jgi:MFS family permease
VIYVGSTIGCALSPNIAVFIALRISQSAGASAAQAVGAGLVKDIFKNGLRVLGYPSSLTWSCSQIH